MQDHRTGWPAHIGAPGTSQYEDQRALLLELVVDPPPGGEPIALVARRLGRPSAAIAAAAAALVRSGLLARAPGGVRATPAAQAFEALWPTRL
jgi:hypothetical protein